MYHVHTGLVDIYITNRVDVFAFHFILTSGGKPAHILELKQGLAMMQHFQTSASAKGVVEGYIRSMPLPAGKRHLLATAVLHKDSLSGKLCITRSGVGAS